MLDSRKFFSVLIVLSSLLVACSGNKESEQVLPSQTTSQVTPQLLAPPPLPPPPIRRVQTTPRSIIKVIEDGGEVDRPKTLAEASRLAKSRKGKYGPSVVKINDDNLHEYAAKGQAIILESPPAAPAPGTGDAADDVLTEETPGEQGESYWRRRALDLRMGWRRTVDSILELQLEAAALRQQFYAEDDPYIRDGQIKPSWDRALDRLAVLEQRSDQYGNELDGFVEEGRRSNAPQGWLNEGWELEPSEDELTWKNKSKKVIKEYQAIEPPILAEEIRNL